MHEGARRVGDQRVADGDVVVGAPDPIAATGATQASVVDNAALRAHRGASHALRTGDRAGFAATRAGNFVLTVHVPRGQNSFLPDAADLGADADTAMGLWPGREGPSDTQVIAVHGGDRCLIRVIDDVACDVFEHLVVIRSCDGRVASEDWFAADQIDEAMELLRSPSSTALPSGSPAEWDRRPR